MSGGISHLHLRCDLRNSASNWQSKCLSSASGQIFLPKMLYLFLARFSTFTKKNYNFQIIYRSRDTFFLLLP